MGPATPYMPAAQGQYAYTNGSHVMSNVNGAYIRDMNTLPGESAAQQQMFHRHGNQMNATDRQHMPRQNPAQPHSQQQMASRQQSSLNAHMAPYFPAYAAHQYVPPPYGQVRKHFYST